MKRKWVEDLDGWNGFKYLKLKGVPLRRSRDGGIVDLKEGVLEKKIAAALIEKRVPLQGAELAFLRKTLGLSLNQFARKLELTASSVFHWEKAARVRLLAVNEIAVRVLCAEELGLSVPGRLSSLLGKESGDVEIVVSSAKKQRSRQNGSTLLAGSPVKDASAARGEFVPAWLVRKRAARKRKPKDKTELMDLSGRGTP